MVVDDYLPVLEGVCFGSSKGMQDGRAVLWVSLLEKAWAKLNGNYDRVAMGTIDMGFIHLAGVPTVDLSHVMYRAEKEVFWGLLKTAQKNGHMMVAGTSDDKKCVE